MAKIQLTAREKLSIKHLNYDKKKVLTPQEIIVWATKKLTQPSKGGGHSPHSRLNRRKHSKRYYKRILLYYQQHI